MSVLLFVLVLAVMAAVMFYRLRAAEGPLAFGE